MMGANYDAERRATVGANYDSESRATMGATMSGGKLRHARCH